MKNSVKFEGDIFTLISEDTDHGGAGLKVQINTHIGRLTHVHFPTTDSATFMQNTISNASGAINQIDSPSASIIVKRLGTVFGNSPVNA
ncbi:MAG: hypothetical protein ACJATY_003215, partial [Spirosomataceae bacterium]